MPIYTYNGTAADNLNEEVLRFARAEHPEWISADGQKWADGLFIFALDPVGRHVGTYMGEDRKVSPEQREDIQNAAKELLRDAQWTDGTIAGIRRGAELINQPWYRSTAFLVTAWTTVAAAVCRRRRLADRAVADQGRPAGGNWPAATPATPT